MTKMTIDYPNVRRSGSCPFCRKAKDKGLITCWSCYRTEGLRHGEDVSQAWVLESAEQRLAAKDGDGYTLTCCQQLSALQRVAELAGAMVVEVPRGPDWQQTYVPRKRIAEIEQALITAGYDMPAVRQRYKQLVKKQKAKGV